VQTLPNNQDTNHLLSDFQQLDLDDLTC